MRQISKIAIYAGCLFVFLGTLYAGMNNRPILLMQYLLPTMIWFIFFGIHYAISKD